MYRNKQTVLLKQYRSINRSIFFGWDASNQVDEFKLVNAFPMNPLFSYFKTFCSMIGNCIMDDAKIIGITPAVLTFSGILLCCPPTSFLPCIFLEYCTGICLSASDKTITNTTTARTTPTITHPAIRAGPICFPS